jgi:trimethylamine--corrinoid protein Co-methyltransferase
MVFKFWDKGRTTEVIEPVKWKAELSLLDEDQLNMIHQASLDILARTGMIMPLADHRYDLLEDHGAVVDRASQSVCFPRDLVEKALSTAPSSFTLYARDTANNLMLDGTQGYLSLDGTGLKIRDLRTGEIRPSTYSDLCEATRVADGLSQIAFLWPCLSAQDQNTNIQALYELYAMLENSGKHIQAMTAVNPITAKGSVEMATVVVGGEEALRTRPIISNFQCSISPLSYDEDALEAALVFAASGVPVGFMNMPIGCATAPATLAGNIAMGNAEILAGITFHQVFFPGAPTFYGSCATMMELCTGALTAGGPDDFLLQAASCQLARHYGLPSNVGTFATGARRSGWQAGVENGISGAVSQFCRADMMGGAGLTNGATVFSFEQLVMDCEIYDIIRNVVQGIRVDEDSLAVDVIQQVGPRNHFLTETHTIENIRKIWQPLVIDRSSDEEWVAKGRPAAMEIARQKAKEILKNHKPVVLKQASVLQEIINEYEKY